MAVLVEATWAVFISGEGTNLQALLDESADLVRVVVSNKKNAAGVLKAKRMGIPVIFFERSLSWESLTTMLKSYGVNAIYLLGFMKLLPGTFVDTWKGQILNLHPSLLPLFPGLEAIEKSFAAESDMGVSVHTVVEEMDAGPLLLQRKIQKHSELSISKLRIAALEKRVVTQVFSTWRFHETSSR